MRGTYILSKHNSVKRLVTLKALMVLRCDATGFTMSACSEILQSPQKSEV